MNIFNWIKNNKSWVFSGVGAATITVILGLVFSDKRDNTDQQRQEGSDNIQAGRDVTIINPEPNIKEAQLEITQVGFTREAEFDVKVRNLGDTDIIIHKITIIKVIDHNMAVDPILRPSARYHIFVDEISEGSSKSIDVSHVIPARKADRFLIALHTTAAYTLKVIFEYNMGLTASFEKRIW